MWTLRNVFKNFLKENTVKHFVIAGDVFEHYNPIEPIRKMFILFIRDLCDLSVAAKTQFWILLGNHDEYKRQYSLDSFRTSLNDFGGWGKCQVYRKPFNVEADGIIYHVNHCGVQGFLARSNFIEKPENVISVNKFKKITLLGHYHINQNKKNIYYCGSPYPIDFGEQGEDKFFNVFKKGKMSKIPINGISFITEKSNENKLKGYKFYVVRLREECTPDKESITRRELFEHRKSLMEKDEHILDCIVELKIKRDSIKDQISKQMIDRVDFSSMIKKLDCEKDFKNYMICKIKEAEV
jgi:DNA repair exonuclease SbcCD nuclease subunit